MRDVALVPQRHVLQRRDHGHRAPGGRGRSGSRSAPGCACAAWREEPFWPGEKNSSASSTSVRCMWRISMATFSMLEAMTPSVAKNIAWRSRGITCVRDRLGRQAQHLADMLLDARVDVGEGADRAGNRAGGDLGPRGHQPGAVARHLGVEAGEGQAHRRGFGMDAVAAADADGVLVLEGAGLQRGQHPVQRRPAAGPRRGPAGCSAWCPARPTRSCPDGRSAPRRRR